jgi:hypothetical protein
MSGNKTPNKLTGAPVDIGGFGGWQAERYNVPIKNEKRSR